MTPMQKLSLAPRLHFNKYVPSVYPALPHQRRLISSSMRMLLFNGISSPSFYKALHKTLAITMSLVATQVVLY